MASYDCSICIYYVCVLYAQCTHIYIPIVHIFCVIMKCICDRIERHQEIEISTVFPMR